MTQTRRRHIRNAAITLALLIGAAWVAPLFLNAGRYGPLLKASLERSLGRKVALGHIALHFFPRPGFTVDNVVIDEDPSFGLEPFARVGRLDCELRWRSLWSSHFYLGAIKLSNPSINLVRNSSGKWNIEDLLLRSRIKPQNAQAAPAPVPSNLAVEIEGARLNFKIGENKKPFTVVNTSAHLDFDYDSERVDFRMAGEPVRTDLEFPTPGLVELDGNWSPARAAGDSLQATLRMQGALLYDWIPLLTGKNPELYGVLSSAISLGGNLRQIQYTGEAHLSQLHRWEQLPSANDLPCDLRFRGRFDRDSQDLVINSLNLAFMDSQVHVEGSIASVASRPDLDLVVAFERSRMEDLLRLGVRVLGKRVAWDVNGRLNGIISVQGPWNGKRYGGFLNAHQVRLDTSSGTFTVSDIALRITESGARLSPARILLAPGVEVVVEGNLRHFPSQQSQRPAVRPAYQLTLSSSAVNLARLVHFGRALGILDKSDMEAEGIGSFTLRLAGGAWPWARPSVTAQASIRSARLVVPGLSEPLNVPRARIQVYGKQVIVNPMLAVMGTSVFSGWIVHQRGSPAPWDFSLTADRLSIEQASQWFEGMGERSSPSFLDRIAGIGAFFAGRHRSFHLAGGMDARGRFSTPLITYRGVSLRDFQASVDIRDRKVRLSQVRFEAGGGHGEGEALVNLSRTPIQISGQAGIHGASIRPLGPYLPAVLGKARGYYSAGGTFEASGLTRAQLASTLKGVATVQLEKVNLGDFDPVGALARRFGMEPFEEPPQALLIPRAMAHLEVQDRQLTLDDFLVDLGGAEFQLHGGYSFDGSTRLLVRADLRGIRQPWTPVHPGVPGPVSRIADLQFGGTLRNLEMMPSAQISQTQP